MTSLAQDNENYVPRNQPSMRPRVSAALFHATLSDQHTNKGDELQSLKHRYSLKTLEIWRSNGPISYSICPLERKASSYLSVCGGSKAFHCIISCSFALLSAAGPSPPPERASIFGIYRRMNSKTEERKPARYRASRADDGSWDRLVASRIQDTVGVMYLTD